MNQLDEFVTELHSHAMQPHISVALHLKASPLLITTPPPKPDRIGLHSAEQMPAGIRSLLPYGTTTAGAVEAIQETAFTDLTNVVTLNGNLKTESTLTYAAVISPVATIATTLRLSRQTLADVAELESMLRRRLFSRLTRAEDKVLLTGTGTLGTFVGLLTAAAAVTGGTVPVTAATMADQINKAIAEIAVAGFQPSGIVMNAADYAGAAFAKMTGDGYIGTPPLTVSMWGLPVVLTPAMPVGQFLVGDFTEGAQLFEREAAAMLIAKMNKDDFVRNMVTVRSEERITLAIYNPACFRKGG